MFNITSKFNQKLKHKSRPLSNIDKKIQFPSNLKNETFNYRPSKDLYIIFNKENNNNLKTKKKSYLNLSQKIFKKQSYNDALLQKKLFYNKIYNKHYGNSGNKDTLGLSQLFNIKHASKNYKCYTSRLSSTSTYRKINLKSKRIYKTQEEIKNSRENSLEKKHILKLDKMCEIEDKDFEKINSSNYSTYISRPISVTYKSLLLKNKNNNNNENNKNISSDNIIKIKESDINVESMKIKNLYIVKYGEILDNFQKFVSKADWIRMNYRNTYINITTNLFKSFEKFYKLMLDKLSDEMCLESFIYFCEEILAWQKFASDEIRYLKKENILLNRNYDKSEKELNEKRNVIKKINENIIKYDLNKVKKGKKDESEVEKIKNEFIKAESKNTDIKYKLIFKIFELKKNLEKNQKENDDINKLKTKTRELEENLAENRTFIKKQEFEYNKRDKLNNEYIEELLSKMEEYDKDKQAWNEKEDNFNNEMIGIKAKVNRLNDIIKEKNELIEKLKMEINGKNQDNYNINDDNIINIPVNMKVIPGGKKLQI